MGKKTCYIFEFADFPATRKAMVEYAWKKRENAITYSQLGSTRGKSMKRKNLPLNIFFISLACFLVTSFAISSEIGPEELEYLQRVKEVELQKMTEGAVNSKDGSGDAPRAAAKFLPIDMDDDGMADTWETTNGLDPSDPNDAWLDPDNDQVVNLFEYQLGSGMNNAATPAVITVGATGAQYTDVSAAIDSVTEAVPGKVLRVAGGTYPVTYLTFSSKVVMIQGGWSPDFSTRDLKLYPTAFDGGLADEIIHFSVGNGRPVIVLDGIHFVNGKGMSGAVSLHADKTAFMRSSVFNCSITMSENTSPSSLDGILKMTNWDTSESDRTIANTVISGNNGNGIKALISEDTTARWRIINTTISNNKNIGSNGKGIDVSTLNNGVLNAHVYNSIIWGNDQDALDIRRNITFNVDHSNISNVSATLGAIYRSGMGMLNTDPLYIDPTAGNYHLQASSPMIDVGINTGVPQIDFEGDPRMVGTGVDIGADEVVSSMMQ